MLWIPRSNPKQAVEKHSSAAFLLFFVVAAYIQVRLTPQNCEGPRKRDFAKLNLHLKFLNSLWGE